MRTIVVLMDTLRRDVLHTYNEASEAITPNLDAFAKEATVFDQHWIGSAPCMPARRDILCGRLNFLERSWGPIEPFDVTLPAVLRQHQVKSHISTDHCHYFRVGGENYVQQFDTWDYIRGQEGDPWISQIDDPSMPQTYLGRVRRQYQSNRTQWSKPEEYPSPKTFQSGKDWIRLNQGCDDFFLMVEAFDPHEPFDVPQQYLDLYPKVEIAEDYFEIPNYGAADVDENALHYLKTRYHALVTMADACFGEFIQHLKDCHMFEDTLLIVTTDHGYCLGEHSFLGKNVMPLFNELAHLPLMVKFPQDAGGTRVSALTQNIDIMPTILEYHGIQIPVDVNGRSWMSLLHEPTSWQRDYVLFGYHGLQANVSDGTYTYFKAPNEANTPLYEYACIPTTIRGYLGETHEEEIEFGHYLTRSKYPLYKIPIYKPTQIVSESTGMQYLMDDMLFDIANDYHQQVNLATTPLSSKWNALLRRALREHDAPLEQFQRLHLE